MSFFYWQTYCTVKVADCTKLYINIYRMNETTQDENTDSTEVAEETTSNDTSTEGGDNTSTEGGDDTSSNSDETTSDDSTGSEGADSADSSEGGEKAAE